MKTKHNLLALLVFIIVGLGCSKDDSFSMNEKESLETTKNNIQTLINSYEYSNTKTMVFDNIQLAIIPIKNSKKNILIINKSGIITKKILERKTIKNLYNKTDIVVSIFNIDEKELEFEFIRRGALYKITKFNNSCQTCISNPSGTIEIFSPTINWCTYFPVFCNGANSGSGNPVDQATIESLLATEIGGGTGGSLIEINQNLTTLLSLTPQQSSYLFTQPGFLLQLHYSVQSHNSAIDKENYRKHIDALMNDTEYYNFAFGHFGTAVNYSSMVTVWWYDSVWLDDPNNFNLDIDYDGQQYEKLTLLEKALIMEHPINAARIRANVSTAFYWTDQKFGSTGGLNDKKDAFRHAFFNAINTRDCFANISPLNIMSASQIVRAFAEAHESEVPTVLQKEKQMDLFNNEIGISYCGNCYTTSSSSIANALMTKIANGELKYISPLNFSLSPLYDANLDDIQDCSTCLNGMISNSILLWTNQ